MNGIKAIGASIVKVLRFLDRLLMRTEEFILSFAIIIIFIMVSGNALSRYLLGTSWAFSSEIALWCVYFATFMGVSYVARQGRHLTMSAFFDIAPYPIRKTLAILIPFGTALVLFVLTYYSIEYVVSQYETGRTTTALRMPYWWVVAPVPVGLFLGGLQFIRNMIVNLVNKDVYIATEQKDRQRGELEEEMPKI
ncbi:TRAP transporter small permease [Salsuginibacillus kocurii]|uniref:TRAP transporter small permease n=1 Tax=Salsuginibacillus kocurii TaxID=427078 RepID=UPI0003797FAF|nr:TRAP transporter small permease [Salsuginibacillus kocurii]